FSPRSPTPETTTLSLHDALPISEAPIVTTKLALQSNVPSLGAADTVFLTATASNSDGSTPTGVVTFAEGSSTLGTATLAGSAGIDRKSTRLNSSHVAISYAVFCL